jgi:hypothetical protein
MHLKDCAPLRFPGASMTSPGDRMPALKQIRALVLENLYRIGPNATREAVRVTVTGLKRPNWHSTQAACAVTVRFTDRLAQPRTIDLWVKQVGKGRRVDEAFDAMDVVYQLLQNANLQRPMPRPLFFDRATNLIFLERVEGGSLLTHALKTCMSPGKSSHLECCRTLHSIGRWLSEFHNVTANGRTTRIVSMLPEIESSLSKDVHFDAKEKIQLGDQLKRVSQSSVSYLEFPVVTSHNRLGLRNILSRCREFHIVDWDAMVATRVPRPAICWWDLTTLLMSIESLLRFHPVLSKRRVGELCNALWKGYVGGIMAPSVSLEDFRTTIMFPILMRYYGGFGGERSLHRLYRRRMGWRYARDLRGKLLLGRGSLF